jgi:CO/xanthine dehydrogenase Mo-binding subunit
MADSIIGQCAPKLDAPAKVTGQPIYGHDLMRPRMLHGAIVRSPHASARIIDIDTSRAQHLPGVRAVLTGRDLPARRFGFGEDNQILKRTFSRAGRQSSGDAGLTLPTRC